MFSRVRALSVVMSFAVGGLSMGDEKTEPTRIAPLDFFVGDWHIDGELDLDGKRTKFEARYGIAQEAGSAWLVGTASVMGSTVHDFWGYDPTTKDFIRIQFQSDGSRGEMHSTGWQHDTLV
jgi:hypothetical protein